MEEKRSYLLLKKKGLRKGVDQTEGDSGAESLVSSSRSFVLKVAKKLSC